MARRQDAAWRGLEEVEGLATTKRHWAVACGPALFGVVDPFLIPTSDRAEWITDPIDPLRQMRVIPAIRRQDCEFLGVSEEEPRSPNVPLSALDLAVYRLDLARFGRHLAAVMGLEPAPSVPLFAPNLVRLALMPKHRLEVVLIVPCRDDDLLTALDILRARVRGEFAVITPTRHMVSPHISSAINAGLFQHASLSELLTITADGKPSTVRDIFQFFAPAKRLTADSSQDFTPDRDGVTNGDLSKQIAFGFESIKSDRIVEEIKSREMRAEFADMAGSADALLKQIIAGFGADEKMARLFMLLRTENPKKPGKLMTFEEIGKQLGVKKQAISAQFAKMKQKYPSAHRFITSLRAPTDVANYSELSPKERRKAGIEESYNYDQG
jgi:DNA-binding MarR family transcriptional regulator